MRAPIGSLISTHRSSWHQGANHAHILLFAHFFLRVFYSPHDPYGCAMSPIGLPFQRRLSIELTCDPEGSASDIGGLNVKEESPCAYVITGTTKAACASS